MSRPAEFLQWAVEMFGRVALDHTERVDRFIEEAAELAQASGMPRRKFDAILDRVYSRPAGKLDKEIGQAQATLEVMAENIGLSSDELAEREFTRVRSIPKEEWQRRHSAKVALGIAQ